MGEYSEAFVGIDVAKGRNAIAIADGERGGEVRYLGEVDSSPASMTRIVRRLVEKYGRVQFCYEAGPTGYGLYRLITALGHDCAVVAPSLIPRRPGERVKTNRRDAVALAKLLRAGELTAVWVPDEGHEAMRDLVRARSAAVETLRVHKQQVSAFMLKHGRHYPRKKAWSMRYLRWLQGQHFDHPAHQIVLQEMLEAVRLAKERVERLEQTIEEFLPAWSLASGALITRDSSWATSAWCRASARAATPCAEVASPRPAIDESVTCWSRAPGPIGTRPRSASRSSTSSRRCRPGFARSRGGRRRG
jgi:transposase